MIVDQTLGKWRLLVAGGSGITRFGSSVLFNLLGRVSACAHRDAGGAGTALQHVRLKQRIRESLWLEETFKMINQVQLLALEAAGSCAEEGASLLWGGGSLSRARSRLCCPHCMVWAFEESCCRVLLACQHVSSWHVCACWHDGVSNLSSLWSITGVEAIGDGAFCPDCFPQQKLSRCLIPQRRKDRLPQRETRS